MFMGTPHRGASAAVWATMFSKIINVVTLSRTLRADLLKDLESNAKTLQEVSSQFVQRATPLRIVSCTEQNFEPPLTSVVSL